MKTKLTAALLSLALVPAIIGAGIVSAAPSHGVRFQAAAQPAAPSASRVRPDCWFLCFYINNK